MFSISRFSPEALVAGVKQKIAGSNFDGEHRKAILSSTMSLLEGSGAAMLHASEEEVGCG
jgi:hypothetical protein